MQSFLKFLEEGYVSHAQRKAVWASRNEKGVKEEAPVASHTHRVQVTVSDPNHTMATKRDEKHQKFVRITHHTDDKSEAVERAKKHFKKKGWKVHDAEHVGMLNKEEVEIDEGLQQTLRKVVPGYAKKQIDKKMDAGKFGKTDADKDANFYRYKKIQDKLKKEESELEEKKKLPGLWANIHAKRKRGERPAKPGEKGYPKTLNIENAEEVSEEGLKDACWKGYEAIGMKMKNGRKVPNCVPTDKK